MFREMRRKKQEISREECVRILQEEKRGVLSLIGEEGYPYGIPINFVYEEETDTIYFHGAKTGHKIDALKACDKACFTVWNRGYQKEDWSYYVTSVIAFGRAQLVQDEQLTYDACRALGMKYFPTKEEVDEELANALSRVQMIALHIEHMTGKLVHEK